MKSLLALLAILAVTASSTQAQPLVLKLINGKNGKPVRKAKVYLSALEHRADGHFYYADPNGEIHFDATAGDHIVVTAIGFVVCGDDRIGESARVSHLVDTIATTGEVTINDCGKHRAEPVPGTLVYFLRPATTWEMLRE